MRSTLHVVASACFLTVVAGLPTGVLARCTDLAAVCAARDKAEIQCPCAAATNHGVYVRCVRGVAKAEADALRLPRECKASVVRCASRSTCGRPASVTCCRLANPGQPHCSVKRSATNCKPPATIGTKPSCCDACASNNCPTTTTTTSTTSTTATTTTTIPSNCGNGHIDPGEACDGSDLGGVSCPGGSAGGAFVACNPDCTLDCSPCPGGGCEGVFEPLVAGPPLPETYQRDAARRADERLREEHLLRHSGLHGADLQHPDPRWPLRTGGPGRVRRRRRQHVAPPDGGQRSGQARRHERSRAGLHVRKRR